MTDHESTARSIARTVDELPDQTAASVYALQRDLSRQHDDRDARDIIQLAATPWPAMSTPIGSCFTPASRHLIHMTGLGPRH